MEEEDFRTETAWQSALWLENMDREERENRHTAIKWLVALLVLALLLVIGRVIAIADSAKAAPLPPGVVQRLDPPAWTATLTTPWGSGNARDGIQGARFDALIMSPTSLAAIIRNFNNSTLSGQVQITSEITSETTLTITAVMADDTTLPPDMILAGPCPNMELPIFASVDVSGTINSMPCDISGNCLMHGQLLGAAGNPCR